MQTETTPATLTPEIVRLCEAHMAADHAMRSAIDADADDQERAHHACDRAQEDAVAKLAALGAKIVLVHSDPEDGYRYCGLTVEVADAQHLIGRKPAWALAEDAKRDAREAAEKVAQAERDAERLRATGHSTLDELRAAIGPRATREAWDLYRCIAAADARAKVARGHDGAGMWGVALYGRADEDTTYCIAVQGVRDAEAARERWRGKLATLEQIASLRSAA